MKNQIIAALFGLSLCFSLANNANAGVIHGTPILSWDVAGVDVADGTGIDSGMPPYTFEATPLVAGVSGALSLGAGVNPSTTSDKYGFKITQPNNPTPSQPGSQNSLAGAIEHDHYFQFSVDVAPGFQLDLASIQINGEATGTGANDVALLSSIDGFLSGNEIATASGVAGKAGGGGFDTDANGFGGPIDLTGSQYQNLMGSVQFRIYGYNTSSGSGSTRLRNLSGDDLIIGGTIRQAPAAVPEPVSLAIFAGLVPIAIISRRRRNAVHV